MDTLGKLIDALVKLEETADEARLGADILKMQYEKHGVAVFQKEVERWFGNATYDQICIALGSMDEGPLRELVAMKLRALLQK